MIKSIKLAAFKSFPMVEVPFKPLTLFSGLNSTGKSSIIQALRMYMQAAEGQSPLLSGYGSINDMRSNFSAPNEPIKVFCIFTDGEDRLELSEKSTQKPQKFPVVFYIGADRFGPQPLSPLRRSFNELPQLGEQCEYTLDVLEQLHTAIIPETLKHTKAEGLTLEYVLRGWLNEISPGTKLNLKIDEKSDSARAEIDSFRPTNVGFGLSYTLPVLVAVLGMAAQINEEIREQPWGKLWEQKRKDNDTLVIIENPEAHLHPQGQTAIGRMLALAASCGVQIVVETHSDHLMDGIRLAVKGKLLLADNVAFHYLSKDSEGRSEIKTPQLHQNGKLDFWPQGFFDQTLKNRALLAKKV